MGRGRSTEGIQRRDLLLAVIVIALSMLAMHQLSINHTAAQPAATSGTLAGHRTPSTQIDSPHYPLGHGADLGHAQLVGSDIGQPGSQDSSCPGCGDHHLMALTCLAALILLAIGWVGTAPTTGRGVRLRRHRPRAPLLPLWLPRPRSLHELSISRT